MCPSKAKRKSVANDSNNGHRRSVSDGSPPVRGQFDRRHSDSETHSFNGPGIKPNFRTKYGVNTSKLIQQAGTLP